MREQFKKVEHIDYQFMEQIKDFINNNKPKVEELKNQVTSLTEY